MNGDHPTTAAHGDSTLRVAGEVVGAAREGEEGLAGRIRRDPHCTRDRSLVVAQALDEYAALAASNPRLSARDYCRRFAEFGNSLQSSIFRQLEVEQLVCENNWLQNAIKEVAWPAPGDRIGSSHVLEELGRGALSRAYLCIQPDVGGRQVVVKVGGPVQIEASLLGRLRHVGIVPILALESDFPSHGTLICMPFLGRSTLQDAIDLRAEKKQKLSAELVVSAARLWEKPTDAVGIADGEEPWRPRGSGARVVAQFGARLAAALEHAHGQDVLHGDVKPSNILLTRQGAPLLMDFNLGASSVLAMTARGGTLPYMPPEQLRSLTEPGATHSTYDRRSDLYSLGVVLYELCSGRLPFPMTTDDAADTKQLAKDLLQRQAAGCVPLRSYDREIPSSLAEAIEACLAFHPADRLASAAVLQQRLADQLRWRRRAWNWTWARPARAAIIAIGTLSASAATAALYASIPPRHERLLAAAVAQRDAGSLEEAEKLAGQALALAPRSREARMEVGRLALARKDFPQAMDQFSYLAEEHDDALSMAFMGYCYVSQGNPTVAIPWFHRAIENGDASASTHNNLAVSLAHGENGQLRQSREKLAESHLEEALRLQPQSPTIRFNWVLHELARARRDRLPISQRAIDYSRELAAAYPDRGNVQLESARLWALVYADELAELENGVAMLARAANQGWAPPVQALQSDDFWSPYRQLSDFTALLNSLKDSPRKRISGGLSLLLLPEDGRGIAQSVASR